MATPSSATANPTPGTRTLDLPEENDFVRQTLNSALLSKGPTRKGVRVMAAFVEFEGSLIRELPKEGIALAKQRDADKGRKKTLTPERAAELAQRAASGAPKALLARDYGISRASVHQYLRHSKLE
jgi:DNA invertase Pin-like site-specific DNA recombinase